MFSMTSKISRLSSSAFLASFTVYLMPSLLALSLFLSVKIASFARPLFSSNPFLRSSVIEALQRALLLILTGSA
jgi:hypothetical protein